MYQGSLGNLDPKTGEITYYPLAPEYNDDRVQLNFVGLRHDVDGKVWTKSVGTQDIFRLDLASGKWERFHPTDELPPGRHYGIYQVISDSKNNLWMAEFHDGHLGKIDAKTTEGDLVSRRRPRMRARGAWRSTTRTACWSPNIAATRSRCSIPRPRSSPNITLPPYTFPYRAQFDKNGEIWAASMSTDRVVRLDPKTGQSVEYLMPRDTNMRTVFVDNSTTPGDVLGRQQPRPRAGQGRAAGLKRQFAWAPRSSSGCYRRDVMAGPFPAISFRRETPADQKIALSIKNVIIRSHMTRSGVSFTTRSAHAASRVTSRNAGSC